MSLYEEVFMPIRNLQSWVVPLLQHFLQYMKWWWTENELRCINKSKLVLKTGMLLQYLPPTAF